MKEDLEKTAYNNLYTLMQHYSAQLFNGRVSIITVCVLLWAYILGVGKDFNDRAASIGSVMVTTKMLVAYFACFLLPMFSSIENAYFRRFVTIIKCGKVFEDKYKIESYFTAFSPITLHPFFFFYVLNISAFSLLVIYMLWSLNGFWISLSLSLSLLVPVVLLLRSYVIFTRWATREVGPTALSPKEA
jgi:hypothetical protein